MPALLALLWTVVYSLGFETTLTPGFLANGCAALAFPGHSCHEHQITLQGHPLTFPHQGQASFPLMTTVPCTDFSYYQLIDSRRTLSHFYFPHFEFQRFPKFQNTHLYTHTHTTFSKMSLVA